MRLYCFDLEGVFLPEMWLRIAEHYQIDDLRLTTRDISSLDRLMQHRFDILRKEKITLRKLQKVIAPMRPFAGARDFLMKVEKKYPTVILSDAIDEMVCPLMKGLGHPTLFCNSVTISKTGYLNRYVLRQRDGKRKAVLAFQKLGFEVFAAGDSYNDLSMLRVADLGVLFDPPEIVCKKNPQFQVAKNYRELSRYLKI